MYATTVHQFQEAQDNLDDEERDVVFRVATSPHQLSTHCYKTDLLFTLHRSYGRYASSIRSDQIKFIVTKRKQGKHEAMEI